MVTWEKAIPPKDMGGLGIGSLRMQNTALLLKWWWRLGKEKTVLWRKVACHKYKLDSCYWFPSIHNRAKPFAVWKEVLDICNTTNQVQDIVTRNMFL